MINIDDLSETELKDLKRKLDEKLSVPLCPCCNTRCGKNKELVKFVEIPVPYQQPWQLLGPFGDSPKS